MYRVYGNLNRTKIFTSILLSNFMVNIFTYTGNVKSTNDLIRLLICIIEKHKYLQSEKRYPKKKTPFNCTLEILSNEQQLFFMSYTL